MIPDSRCQGKVKYTIGDTFKSILAMMFFQDKSMLEFQRSLETTSGKNNLMTMFGVQDTPSDRQIKTIADAVDYRFFSKIFSLFLKVLERCKYLKKYEFIYEYHLLAIDGSQYFSSQKISCDHCLSKKTKNGEYHSHQIVQPAIVKPGLKEIFPLFPEAVQNTDGEEKQDCEINAGKRCLAEIRENHPNLKFIVNGDGLYSKQPFIEEVKSHNMSYILVAKKPDHPTLYENIENLDKQGRVKRA